VSIKIVEVRHLAASLIVKCSRSGAELPPNQQVPADFEGRHLFSQSGLF